MSHTTSHSETTILDMPLASAKSTAHTQREPHSSVPKPLSPRRVPHIMIENENFASLTRVSVKVLFYGNFMTGYCN